MCDQACELWLSIYKQHFLFFFSIIKNKFIFLIFLTKQVSHLFHLLKRRFLLDLIKVQLLGNCQTFQLSLNNFFLCFSSSTDCPSLSLHLINLDNVIHPHPQGPLSSVIQYALWILCVSFFFLNIKFIFGLCPICV